LGAFAGLPPLLSAKEEFTLITPLVERKNQSETIAPRGHEDWKTKTKGVTLGGTQPCKKILVRTVGAGRNLLECPHGNNKEYDGQR